MGDDRFRIFADDLASEIGIGLAPSLAGIPLDGEVLPLDIAQPAKFFEKRLVFPVPYGVTTGVADGSDGTCGDDDRDPMLLRRLLRQCIARPRARRPGEYPDEFTPPHSMTSSAEASIAGGIVRFSKTGGAQVDAQLQSRGLLDRNVRWAGAPYDARGALSQPRQFALVSATRRQTRDKARVKNPSQRGLSSARSARNCHKPVRR